MKEPNLKKKSLISKVFKNQLFITVSTFLLLMFILIGSSYAILNAKTETGLTDVVVQSGNLIATISSSDEIIQMNYNTLGVSNEIGLSYDPYNFTVSNNGEGKIAYYELRIVDKEYEISTLPHKSLNYSLSVNGGDYTNPQNLGDNRSYIYVGGSLEAGESDTFDLKLWVNEEFGRYANNKVLKASIELTLYSEIPTRNYIIYDSQGGNYIPKTSVVSKRISMQKPIKNGYEFVGWSSSPDGEVEYEENAIYNGTNGITLYAIWELSVHPPVCTFILGNSDLINNCSPTEFYLECVSDYGFADSEIIAEDIIVLIDGMESQEGMVEVSPTSKTTINKGYRYNINMMITSFKVGDSLLTVNLRDGSVTNSYNQGNEYVIGNTFYSDSSPCS